MGSSDHRSKNTDGKDSFLFLEIHQAEEEIDRYLQARKEEAEGILSKAADGSEKLQASGRESAQREAAALRRALLLEAEEEAERIRRQGNAIAEQERSTMESKGDKVRSIILRYLLGEST
jgi:vacuolar-type H+-ATPase subunit H